MSSGNEGGHGLSATFVERILVMPEMVRRLSERPKINRTFDLPYLGGYSNDGATVYIDRHLPNEVRIGAKMVNVLPFLIWHETVEKAAIDLFGWPYTLAHALATVAEEKDVRAAGIAPKPYEDALKPYIKADAHEKLKRCPPDLDLTPYIDEHDYLTLHALMRAGVKAEEIHAVN